MKTIIFNTAAVLLLTLTACSKYESVDTTPNPYAQEEETTPTGNVANVYTTTGDGTNLLRQSKVSVQSGANMAPTTIELDPAQQYQTMDGFGFAVTYATCYNLLKMEKEARTEFLKKTYSTTEGYGVSYARISIGCNDFSSAVYTLCDEPGLDNFRLYRDETDYVIPVLKEILTINPNVKIIASPWTCPKWMKVSDIASMAPFDSWTDGHLNPNYYATYANYFVKFIQTMKEQGINIYAVSPQNEPLNHANCASLYMPWQEEAPFVKELATAFRQNGLDTKIYVYDHNYDYGSDDQQDYPIKVYNALGTFEGSDLVVGAAYHDYGGSNAELTDIHQQAADRELIFSESSIGMWNDGRNLSKRLMEDMRNVTLGTVNQWCKAVLVWNLMLDVNMGPNLDGGCQTCFGAVDISADYKTITRNSHYYIITHLSSVVQPGAVRVGVTDRSVVRNGLTYATFINPDGSNAAVLLNSSDEAVVTTLASGTQHVAVTVPAQGVVSCNWK